MPRNRATQRRADHGTDRRITIRDYFFQTKQDGDQEVLIPRTTPVTRDEMWWWGEWLCNRLPAHNRWYKKLWRWVTRSAFVTYNPFALVRAHPNVRTPEPLARPGAGKTIDASGQVVESVGLHVEH